jgi:hypothetical protein
MILQPRKEYKQNLRPPAGSLSPTRFCSYAYIHTTIHHIISGPPLSTTRNGTCTMVAARSAIYGGGVMFSFYYHHQHKHKHRYQGPHCHCHTTAQVAWVFRFRLIIRIHTTSVAAAASGRNFASQLGEAVWAHAISWTGNKPIDQSGCSRS